MIPTPRPAPTLHRSLTARSSRGRPFSIAVPARLANSNETRLPAKPRGFLAEKGPFPYRERMRSYESIYLASGSELGAGSASVAGAGAGAGLQGGAGELETLRRQAVEQRRMIEALRRTISDLVVGGGQRM